MKTKLIILVFAVALLGIEASAKIKEGKALSGNSLTDFGKYTIENASQPLSVNGEEVPTFNLMYENTRRPIQIGVVSTKEKCTNFIVKCAEFEVEYVCNQGIFGVKKISKEFRELPVEAIEAKLNRVSYFAQRVISQNPKSQEELLGLIACYFPNLINEEYQASLQK